MTFGSLFSGVGCMDRGLELAGLKCRWQVEKEATARSILEREWPEVERHGDIIGIDPANLFCVDVLAGGDPCPFRSNARSIHGTDSPDLWPEFLRFVSALRPLWVLREHVPAPDADDCAADLARLGYSPIVIEMDGAEITGQSRPREFLCGVLASSGICPVRVFSEPEGHRWNPEKVRQAGQVARCLTTHPRRFDSCDNYVLEPGAGMRILASVERERLMGIPDGWTDGMAHGRRFGSSTRARLTGNALIVQKAQWLGEKIMASR